MEYDSRELHCIGCSEELESVPEKRREIGLPKDLDKELFEAIDNFTKLQDQADTDPDDDPEAAEIDVDAEESGLKPKRVKRSRSTLLKKPVEGRPLSLVQGLQMQVCLDEEMEPECKPKRIRHQSTPQKQPMLVGKPNKSLPVAKETEHIKPIRSRHRSTLHSSNNIDETEEPIIRVEETEQVASKPQPKVAPKNKKVISKQPGLEEEEVEKSDTSVVGMAGKLKASSEMIRTIIAADLADDETDEGDTSKTQRVRHRAEKLISCLLDLAKNLELSNLVQEC